MGTGNSSTLLVEMLTSLTTMTVSLEDSETWKLKLLCDPATPLLSMYTKESTFDALYGCSIHSIQETESA